MRQEHLFGAGIRRCFVGIPDHDRHHTGEAAYFLDLEPAHFECLCVDARHLRTLPFRLTVENQRFACILAAAVV